MFPSLSLPLLASLTPSEVQLEIIDEYFDDIPFDYPADLVGLSIMTPQAPRAYQIADEFKKRRKKVVMGGIHASALPEEALNHSNAVVVGEAEGIWRRVLEDFKDGRMEGIYRSPKFPELSGLPTPRYDLLKKDRYRLFKFNFPVQAGRGCPFKCEFCSVNRFFGGKYRWRPVGEVVGEIQKNHLKRIFFVDDNIIGQRSYALDLFKALIPLKIRWGGQGSLNIAKDEELLRLAGESGCGLLYIGVESISDSNFPSIGKNLFKVEDISKYFRKIHQQGIRIRASIIFGMDNDDADVFQRTAEFLIREKVAYADFNILTPMPGTEIRRRLEEEGRIRNFDWAAYDGLHAVFLPKKITPERLEEGLWQAYQEFYSIPNIFKRILGAEKHNGALRTVLSNFIYQKISSRRRHPLCGE